MVINSDFINILRFSLFYSDGYAQYRYLITNGRKILRIRERECRACTVKNVNAAVEKSVIYVLRRSSPPWVSHARLIVNTLNKEKAFIGTTTHFPVILSRALHDE